MLFGAGEHKNVELELLFAKDTFPRITGMTRRRSGSGRWLYVPRERREKKEGEVENTGSRHLIFSGLPWLGGGEVIDDDAQILLIESFKAD